MTRILQIIENFDGQATETWLSEVFFELKKNNNETDWTFFCTLNKPGKFSGKIIAEGGKIICSPKPVSAFFSYIIAFRRAVKTGSYDIIHCHQDIMSAIYLVALIGLPKQKFVVHIHNTSLDLPISNRVKEFVCKKVFKLLCCLFADNIVGVSKEALKAVNGRGILSKSASVIHCGINLLPYKFTAVSESTFRERMNIPKSSKILLFVGRMTSYKNPNYAIHVLDQIISRERDVYAVFVGSGPFESHVEKLASEKLLLDRVRVLGWRDDVPLIMQESDVLIWPGIENPKEGLGLGIVEAQAAGLKIVMSLNIPDEAIVIPELVEVVPLAAGPKIWANKVINAFDRDNINKKKAMIQIEKSSFSISKSASKISLLYNT